MRSEERAGIVAAILLFTWGTLVTEPLHIFTDFIFELLKIVEHKIGLSSGGRAGTLIAILVMAVISLVLMLVSRTDICDYIPCGVMVFSVAGFVIESIVFRSYNTKQAIAVAVALALIGVLYFGKFRRAMICAADVCILSLGMYILTGLVFVPLSKINNVTSKIFYVTGYQHGDLSAPFAGMFHIPAIVWGIFFAVLLMLPTAYYAFSRKKG